MDHVANVIKAAVAYYDAAQWREGAQELYRTSYTHWKHRNDAWGFPNGSPEQQAMNQATAEEYAALVKAKRQERYRRDCLLKAIRQARESRL